MPWEQRAGFIFRVEQKVFWNVRPCCVVGFYRPFVGIVCSIHLEVAINIHLRNVVKFLTDHIQHSRREYSSYRLAADTYTIMED